MPKRLIFMLCSVRLRAIAERDRRRPLVVRLTPFYQQKLLTCSLGARVFGSNQILLNRDARAPQCTEQNGCWAGSGLSG